MCRFLETCASSSADRSPGGSPSSPGGDRDSPGGSSFFSGGVFQTSAYLPRSGTNGRIRCLPGGDGVPQVAQPRPRVVFRFENKPPPMGRRRLKKRSPGFRVICPWVRYFAWHLADFVGEVGGVRRSQARAGSSTRPWAATEAPASRMRTSKQKDQQAPPASALARGRHHPGFLSSG